MANDFKVRNLEIKVTATHLIVNGGIGENGVAVEADCTQNTAKIRKALSGASDLKKLKKELIKALAALEDLS